MGGHFRDVVLCPEATKSMEDYHQSARTLAQHNPAKRLAEHQDKYPGFLVRMAFALHCLESAEQERILEVVSYETFKRAKRIMQCLHHHSVAVYSVLDSEAGDISRLAVSACEAILSKGWTTLMRGDLTRYATGWQGVDDRIAESAIDFLIELGWLHDVTPAATPGRRGRRSSGQFIVNPQAHQRFIEHSERIKSDRALRSTALRELAGQRGKRKSQ